MSWRARRCPSRVPRAARPIPVRTITDEDLRSSLRQGWEDFRDLRGDLVFAGLIYTLIGLAAVVMTTSRPLMPFFFPVVAGVALLGPVAAVGFYELARRRESGEEVHWFNFLDVRKRPSLDDMGIVAGLLLLIFVGWLLAAGVLYALLFGWATPTSIGGFLSAVFTTPRGWALILGGAIVGAIFGWIVLALSVASLPMLVDCDVSAARSGLRVLARRACQQGRDGPLGNRRRRAAGARLDPAVRRPRLRPAVARLFDLAPLHPADRSRRGRREPSTYATSRPSRAPSRRGSA